MNWEQAHVLSSIGAILAASLRQPRRFLGFESNAAFPVTLVVLMFTSLVLAKFLDPGLKSICHIAGLIAVLALAIYGMMLPQDELSFWNLIVAKMKGSELKVTPERRIIEMDKLMRREWNKGGVIFKQEDVDDFVNRHGTLPDGRIPVPPVADTTDTS